MVFGVIHFVLHPKIVNVSDSYGLSSSIRIVFSRLYGGDAQVDNGIIFNRAYFEIRFLLTFWISQHQNGCCGSPTHLYT